MKSTLIASLLAISLALLSAHPSGAEPQGSRTQSMAAPTAAPNILADAKRGREAFGRTVRSKEFADAVANRNITAIRRIFKANGFTELTLGGMPIQWVSCISPLQMVWGWLYVSDQNGTGWRWVQYCGVPPGKNDFDAIKFQD